MQIRVGYELIYECPQATPMVLMLNIHYSRVADLVVVDQILTQPQVSIRAYRDGFGNWCSRIVAPKGEISISTNAIVQDSGLPDVLHNGAPEHAIEDLPDETLVYLLGSRYCETDRLTEAAWVLFGHLPPGWSRVKAICDFVHKRLKFGYQYARPTRTALEAYQERKGVCRDFTHLAITFCRCLNIPARYCTGYLGDIGVPPAPEPMDFTTWFEAYLGGRWYTFDPRHNIPRIGRVLIAQGRDAADVPLSSTFGPNELKRFKVWTDEVKG